MLVGGERYRIEERGGAELWYNLNKGLSLSHKSSRTEMASSEFFQVGIREPGHYTIRRISHGCCRLPLEGGGLGMSKRGLFPGKTIPEAGEISLPFLRLDLGNRSQHPPYRERVFYTEENTEERTVHVGAVQVVQGLSWKGFHGKQILRQSQRFAYRCFTGE